MDATSDRVNRSYFFPAGPDTDAKLEQAWLAEPDTPHHAASASAIIDLQQSGGESRLMGAPVVLPVMFGRTITAERVHGGAARFGFMELCDKALGAADYMALAEAFHTVFLTNIPRMSLAVRRIFTLVIFPPYCRWCYYRSNNWKC